MSEEERSIVEEVEEISKMDCEALEKKKQLVKREVNTIVEKLLGRQPPSESDLLRAQKLRRLMGVIDDIGEQKFCPIKKEIDRLARRTPETIEPKVSLEELEELGEMAEYLQDGKLKKKTTASCGCGKR